MKKSEVMREPHALETIRLTIELTRQSDTPNQWTSHCLELDVISGARTPQGALEAIAEAVRMMVDHERKRVTCSARDAFVAIAANVSTRRDGRESCPGCKREIDPDTCHCGSATADHNQPHGHSPVPMGCICHLSRSDDEIPA